MNKTAGSNAMLMKHPSGTYVRVKQGFSWPALLLGSLWALVRRLWLLALVLFAVDALLWVLGGYAAQTGNPVWLLAFLLANIAAAAVRGRYGNRWHLTILRRRGFVPALPQDAGN